MENRITIKKIIRALKLLKAYIEWFFKYYEIKKKIWKKIKKKYDIQTPN